MTQEQQDLHQTLMDQSYELWKNKDDWSKEDFFDHLDYLHRLAVALGNLNYQVGNGGFSQWEFNDYRETHASFLQRLVVDPKKYPQLYEALVIMKEAIKEIESYEVSEDDNEEGTESALDKLDTRYYALKNLESEMNEYLTEKQKEGGAN